MTEDELITHQHAENAYLKDACLKLLARIEELSQERDGLLMTLMQNTEVSSSKYVN